MLKAIDKLVKEFLEISKDKSVRIISHHDTDGITSAAILAKTFRRLHINFSVKIVKGLDEEILTKELQRNEKELLFFSDLASSSLEYFQNLKNPVFILDHHEINQEKLNPDIKIINPHLFNEEETCGAGLCYLFSKAISQENKDLAKLAIIGLIGDRHENNISKINQQIIKDTIELKIKKGLQIFSATRPLRKSLEYSTEIYIPGVTGSQPGVIELLRETNISMDKTLYELTDEEMSNLLTAITIRRAKCNKKEDILGNIYLLKFFNRIEDVRELSVLINACSRLGFSDVALSFCMENEKAKIQAQEIYLQYKQQLISALNSANTLDKIKGNGFVILNARDTIKDTIIGTVTSILSSSLNYEEGTVLIGMAYNKDKIKVSARIVGKDGRNLKEMLEHVVVPLKGEVGGHKVAAGCLIEKGQEAEFIDELKKHLEIEIVKV
jgi:RecJ-like exonuclease